MWCITHFINFIHFYSTSNCFEQLKVKTRSNAQTLIKTELEHIPRHNENQTKDPYAKLVAINTSNYFEHCWLFIDSSSTNPIIRSTDPSNVYTDTESFIFGVGCIPLWLCGLIINSLVILAILRSSELRKEYLTPSILSITLNDFSFSISTILVMSLMGLTKDLPLPYGGAWFGFVTLGLWQGSIFNLLAIALLRCMAVFFPQILQTKSFKRACIIAPILAWLFAFITLVPVLSRQYGQFGFICKEFTIGIIAIDETGSVLSPNPFGLYTLGIMISGILLVLLNVITFLQVHRKTQKLFLQITNENLEGGNKILQKEKRLGKMVMAITGSFFVVFAPQNIIRIVDPWAPVSNRTAHICFDLLARFHFRD